MPSQATLTDPAVSLQLVVTPETVNNVALRLWRRTPQDADFVQIANTGTGPTTSITVQVGAVPRTTQLAYWLGLNNSKRAGGKWEVSLKLIQNGVELSVTQANAQSDHIEQKGTLNASGNDTCEDWVDLL